MKQLKRRLRAVKRWILSAYLILPAPLRAGVSFDVRREVEGVCDVVLEGINMRDYPDFCDAFIVQAFWGRSFDELTEVELEVLNSDGQFVHEAVWDRIN